MEPDPSPIVPAQPTQRKSLLKTKLPRSIRIASIFAAGILSLEAFLLVALPWPLRFAVDELFIPSTTTSTAHTPSILAAAFAVFASSFPDSVLHWLSQAPGGTAYLLFIAAVMIVVMIAYAVLSRTGESMKIRIARRILQITREHLLHSIVTREQTYIDSRFKDDLKARLTSDLDDLNDLVTNTLGVIGYDLAALSASLIVMAALDLRLALLMGAALPIVYSANGSIIRNARLSEKRRESDGIRMEREF